MEKQQQQEAILSTAEPIYRRHASRQWSFAAHLITLVFLPTVVFHTFCPTELRVHPALVWHSQPNLSPDALRTLLLSIPDGRKAREWSTYLTSQPHLPGQGFDQAQWTRTKWEEFGIENSTISSYNAYCSYPNGQRLALLDLSRPRAEQVLYEAALVEDDNFVKTGKDKQPFIPAFHAFSAPGNVTASYVFANFGMKEDLETLVHAGISLKGKIAIMKTAQVTPYVKKNHMDVFRGAQIRNAQDMGIVGVIVYADPETDGNMTPDEGHKAYPDGPSRPETMIERGTLGAVGMDHLILNVYS